MGGSNALFKADEGAETAVYLAALPEGGAQGKFFAEMRKFGKAIARFLSAWRCKEPCT